MKRYTVFLKRVSSKNRGPNSFEVQANNIDDAWAKALSSQIVTYNDREVENVMLHFSELQNSIDISEAHTHVIFIEGFVRKERTVCPECLTHEQGSASNFHDCKTTFTRDGKVVDQCGCYSKEHGMR